MKNCRKDREDSMTKTIATFIRKINKTFIAIFMGMLLEYLAYYHHAYD